MWSASLKERHKRTGQRRRSKYVDVALATEIILGRLLGTAQMPSPGSPVAWPAGANAAISSPAIERITIMSPIMTDLPPWILLTSVNYGTNREKSKSSREKTVNALFYPGLALPSGQSLLRRCNRRRRSISKSRPRMKSVDALRPRSQ
jgi:hypothetical protein